MNPYRSQMMKSAAALAALLISTAAIPADTLIDNFDDGNFTMENWDNAQWLFVDGSTTEDPLTGDAGTGFRAANTLGIFDIPFVSSKAANIVSYAGGNAYEFGSAGITPASPNNSALDWHTLLLIGGYNRSALSDLSAMNYVRVTAWRTGAEST